MDAYARKVPVELWWSSLVAADHGLHRIVDHRERTRAASHDRSADQGRSLVAAALLRVAVGHRLGVPPLDVRVDRRCPDCGAQHGPPRILGPGAEVPYASVSHSGVLIVVALADAPVGVDVQRIADLPDGDAAAAARWVAREAAYKMGTGASPAPVHPVTPPLPGYAAAVAAWGAPDRPPVLRRWPPGLFSPPGG